MTLFGDDPSSAVLSPDGRYRYRLRRMWASDLPHVLFVMLNPSTADASIDDPTIRRCMSFARTWHHGGIEVVNLFAYRTHDPDELDLIRTLDGGGDIVGPDNDRHVGEALSDPLVGTVVVAWGAHMLARIRGRNMYRLILAHDHRPMCLGITKKGDPTHPLYVRQDTEPVEWMPPPS